MAFHSDGALNLPSTSRVVVTLAQLLLMLSIGFGFILAMAEYLASQALLAQERSRLSLFPLISVETSLAKL